MVRTTGSKSFTASETQLLLDIVDRIRPLQRQKWEEVAVAYNEQISGKDWCPRDADALKRRFMVLAYAKKPSEDWREFMDRAMTIHHGILEDAGASVSLQIGGLTRASDGDGMLLLTENEAELVHAANVVPMQGYDDEYGNRIPSTSLQITPVRTGKRGRPPGSTTGSAAKRMAQQAETVVMLSKAFMDLQKQLREVREVLASVVETQANQSSVLAVLQQQLQQNINSSLSNIKANPSLITTTTASHENDGENDNQSDSSFQHMLA